MVQVCVYAMGGVRATGDRSVDGGDDVARDLCLPGEPSSSLHCDTSSTEANAAWHWHPVLHAKGAAESNLWVAFDDVAEGEQRRGWLASQHGQRHAGLRSAGSARRWLSLKSEQVGDRHFEHSGKFLQPGHRRRVHAPLDKADELHRAADFFGQRHLRQPPRLAQTGNPSAKFFQKHGREITTGEPQLAT